MRLDTPEVVAVFVDVVPHFSDPGVAVTDHAESTRVVGEVRESPLYRVDCDLVDAEVAEAKREVGVVRLVDGVGVEFLHGFSIEQVYVAPAVEERTDLDFRTDGTQWEVLGIGPRWVEWGEVE